MYVSNLDIKIHDNLLTIMLLYSLPGSYENFRCAIESRDELPKPEQLRVKIIEEDSSRGNAQVDKIEGAMYLDKHSKKITGKTFKFKCFKCHNFGHKASECTKKGEKTKETRCVESCSSHESCETLIINHVSDDCRIAVDAKRRQEWIFDSGCTSHMCNDVERFAEVHPASQKLKLATDSLTTVQGKGTVKLLACNDDRTRKIQFENTLLVPDLRSNLISIAQLTERGCEVTFKRDVAYVVKKGEVKLTADRRGDLYYLREQDASASVVCNESVDLYRWHERMGHLNARDLMKLLKKSDIDPIKIDSNLHDCDVCAKGKMVSLPFVKSNSRCNEKLQIIYSDVVGPMRVQSNGGNKYFITFIDDCTRWCEVFMLKNKSDVLSKFKIFKCHVENLTGRKIKYLHTDNGTEYKNKFFDEFLENEGIKRRFTTPYSPQSNGIAERMNRTLIEMARCMILSSGISPSFWAEAVATACYLRNRCPTSSLNGEIPYEKWFERPVNVKYLKTFGTKVHVLEKEPGKDKFAARSSLGIFVGYPADAKGYKIWIPESRRIVVSRDVKFQEGKLTEIECKVSNESLIEPQCEKSIVRKTVDIEIQTKEQSDVSLSDEPSREEIPLNIQPNVPVINEESTENTESTEISHRNIIFKRGLGRPRIQRGQVGRPRKIYNMVEIRESSDNDSSTEEYVDTDDFAGAIETTLKEALSSDEKVKWEEAILSEIRSLVNNDTWEIVKKPSDRNIVCCRYVLMTKLDW